MADITYGPGEIRARGGTDHIDNLQLLCNACNSLKGTRTQAEFMAVLQSR